jgi:hypothetical protein
VAGPSFLAGYGKASIAGWVSREDDRYDEQNNQEETQSSH